MTAQGSLLETAQQFPTQPGVYVMKDAGGRILYVGKAKNLRNRVRSYFQSPEKLSPRIFLLTKRVVSIEITVTPTELEALLLECNLIKQHRPRYNIRLKDDKNYPYVVLDFTHPFPMFRVTRKVVHQPHLKYFGPFIGGANEVSRFLLKTFQIRDCSDHKFSNRIRPCLNYEIGTCTAPCVGYVSQEDYNRQIHQAILFLQGKQSSLIKELKRQMQEESNQLKFELAKQLRDKISALQKLSQKQGAILTGEEKDIDVVATFQTESEVIWLVLFIRNGILMGRRSHKSSLLSDLQDLTRTFLEQFYLQSVIPDEIWLQNDLDDREMLEAFLKQKGQKTVKIRVPRGERALRLLGMAFENARLIYQEESKQTQKSASELLKDILDLKEVPYHLEGMDVSNLQGSYPAISLVHFAGEKPLKSRYRLFYPRTIEGQNDFGMIYEACLRRFKNDKNPPPDLLMIDGGRGQLQSAVRALEELNLDVPVCALAKARTESAFTLKEVETSEERIFLPNRKNPIVLEASSPALHLLQQLRDESHRFALKAHRRRRSKGVFEP